MAENADFIRDFSVIDTCVYHDITEEEFDVFCQKYRFVYMHEGKKINLYHIVYWLYNQFTPGRPFYDDFQNHNGFEIFEKCKTGYSPNCACYAIMLNDILLALKYKSKAVWCLSEDPLDTECHALNHVFDEERDQWIAVDPACNSIICDEEGNPIDLLTLRNTIRSGNWVYPHRNKHMRRSPSYVEEYNTYMKKNSYQFLTHNEQGMSYPLDETAVLIHPLNTIAKYQKSWKSTHNIAYLYS